MQAIDQVDGVHSQLNQNDLAKHLLHKSEVHCLLLHTAVGALRWVWLGCHGDVCGDEEL